MKTILANYKTHLKKLALEIRTLKKARTLAPNGFVRGLASLQEDFRVHHIVRCLLRGRTIEQIENNRTKKPNDEGCATEIYLQQKVSHQMQNILKTKYSIGSIFCHCKSCAEKIKEGTCSNCGEANHAAN